jgi:hypothetical protein
MNKQLTAVEWLDNKIIELDVEFDMTLISRKTYWVRRNEILEQANKMFEQQIINAYKEGCFDNILDEKTDKVRAEQYYSETFNK